MNPASALNFIKNTAQKGATLGGKIFGMGKGKAAWNNKYSQVMGKKTLIQQRNRAAALGQTAAKIGAVGTAVNVGQNMLGDAGPEGDDFSERAYNQLRYGVDMTDSQMEEAIGKGQTFQDTGMIGGENGLNEEQVMQYLAKEGEDKRGIGERIASGALSAASMVPGFGTLIGTPTEMLYDSKLGKARNLTLENAVGKLKLDANEIKMRKDMEKKQGKFMSEGLLGKDFGRGNVRQQGGGIKAPVDREAQAAEAEALKEYEAIKAKDGVHAALASPAALKAGRQVYLDVQEASGGNKDTAEALLSGVGGQEGVGLTDQATMEKYYGNPEANAASNQKLADEASAKQTAAQQANAAASAQTSLEAQDKARSGEIDIKPATNAEQVVNNQATIATQKGYFGQSPVSVEQQAYMNARGQKSDVQMQNSLNSPEWKTLLDRHRNAATANAQKAREYIAPEHRMGVDPNGQAARDATAARIFNPASGPVGADGKPLNPAAPAPISAQVNAAANAPTITPEQKYGPKALEDAKNNGTLLSTRPPDIGGPARRAGEAAADGFRNAQGAIRSAVEDATTIKRSPPGVMPGATNEGFRLPDMGAPVRNLVENATTMKGSPGAPMPGMKPTPYGLGTGTPGVPTSIPQGIPDIGGPARRFAENATTIKGSPGAPMPGMKASPYGLGTATPGVPTSIPQGIPDIGAGARNAVQGALTQQSSPPGVAPKKPMDQAEIAKMIAEQERKKVEARNKANPQASPIPRPDPMRRFR
jgi:hypothetical protein